MPYSRKTYAPRRQQPRRAPPAVKNYVKKAIESKRDTITACTETTQSIGYNAPLIYDLTPLGSKSQGQDVDFVNIDLNIALLGQEAFTRVMLIQWFPDNSDVLPTLAELLCGEAGSATSYYEGYDQALVHQKFVVIKDKLVSTSLNKNDSRVFMKMQIKKSSLQRKVFRSVGAGNYKNQIYLVAFTDRLVTSPLTINVGNTFQFKNRD